MPALPSLRTWVAGEVVTAAEMNSNVRDGGNFFLAPPIAELRQTVAQTFTTGVSAAVLLDTEDLDSANGHSTVTNTSRYTGQYAGWHQFSGGLGWASSAVGARVLQWNLNGNPVNGTGVEVVPVGGGGATDMASRNKFINLNGTTDYVELFGLQSSGGNLATLGTGADQGNVSVRFVSQ